MLVFEAISFLILGAAIVIFTSMCVAMLMRAGIYVVTREWKNENK